MIREYSQQADELVNQLGQAIRLQRKRLGLTQDQVAERTGQQVSNISKMENGKFANFRIISEVLVALRMTDQLVGKIEVLEQVDETKRRTTVTKAETELLYSLGEPLDAAEFEQAVNITPQAIYPVMPRTAHHLRGKGYAVRQTTSGDFLATLPENVPYDRDSWQAGEGSTNLILGGMQLINGHIDLRHFDQTQRGIIRHETEELKQYLNAVFQPQGLMIHQLKLLASNEHGSHLKRAGLPVKSPYYNQLFTDHLTRYLETEER